MEKRHRKAHVFKRFLSMEVDSAARAELAALGSDMVKFSFAEAVAEDI